MKKWMQLTSLALAMTLAACAKKEGTTDPGTDTTGTGGGGGGGGNASVATLVAAANIAKCGNSNADGTARIIDTMTTATVMVVGNAANPGGRPADYSGCYDPVWGRFKARTFAALGNHDYDSLPDASGAFGYFGAKAGDSDKGYYSYDLGDWHVVVLNFEPGTTFYGSGSAQQAWVAADLQASTKQCKLAVFHRTRFFSSSGGGNERTTLKSMWSILAANGVDVVISGRQYFYERMRPVNPDGVDDPNGIVQFNVGLGGENTAATASVISPISAAIGYDFGVLKMTLRSSSYDFSYIPSVAGGFTESGTGACH